MKIVTLVVGQMATNCYLVYDLESKESIVIDPGDDADYIRQNIFELEITPRQILATHGHFDHLLAVAELKLAFNVPFLLNKKDVFLLKKLKTSTRHFLKILEAVKPEPDNFISENEEIILGKEKLKIIETPGHTPGSISLHNEAGRFLISGDLVFAQGGLGRTDFCYSNKSDFRKSLKRVKGFQNWRIFPGHGNSFKLNNSQRSRYLV